MLLCRDYVERNGPLDGNTYVEKLGLERKKLAKKTRKRLRLLTVYSYLYGLSFIPAPPGEQQQNWRLVLADPPEPPTTTVYTGVVARFGVPHHQTSSTRGRGDLGKIDVDVLLDMLGGVEDVDQLDAGAFEKPAAPDASARQLPTLLRLDADFCLELARELLRSEL